MKTIKIKILAAALVSVAVIAIVNGCATRPPSQLEMKIFDVKTNYTPVIVLKTNLDATTGAPVVTSTTQNVPEGYVLTPKADVKQNIQATAGSVGTLVGSAVGTPYSGTLASLGAGLVLSLWGWFRSSKKASAGTESATALAQIIETAREILKTVPQGEQYDQKLVQWMMQHQTDTGTVLKITDLVDASVNNDAAKGVAAQIAAAVNALREPSAPAPQPGPKPI